MGGAGLLNPLGSNSMTVMLLEEFNESQRELLQSLASRLIWWQSVDEALQRPVAVVLQGFQVVTAWSV